MHAPDWSQTTNSSAEYDFRENLMQQVIDGSDFESYSQDLYDSYAAGMEESYESYMEMFGCETVEEVYNLFGLTEADIEKEVMNSGLPRDRGSGDQPEGGSRAHRH